MFTGAKWRKSKSLSHCNPISHDSWYSHLGSKKKDFPPCYTRWQDPIHYSDMHLCPPKNTFVLIFPVLPKLCFSSLPLVTHWILNWRRDLVSTIIFTVLYGFKTILIGKITVHFAESKKEPKKCENEPVKMKEIYGQLLKNWLRSFFTYWYFKKYLQLCCNSL